MLERTASNGKIESIMGNGIKDEIASRSSDILDKIKDNPKLSQYITEDKIPSVFIETDDVKEIRLIVIGQDPTVKNEVSRKTVSTVLNLDKPNGSISKYLSTICEGLGLNLQQHVYATNYAKNFFTRPPTQIKECNLLDETSRYWLPLLQSELSRFPNCTIITLGEPLLRVLLIKPHKAFLRDYWGYTSHCLGTEPVFSYIPPEENKLTHKIFPFPHQPSIRKAFYRATLKAYLTYVKNTETP